MSPEYGATCTMFPIDQVTLDYLRFTGRDEEHLALVEAYAKAQGLWHDPGAPEPVYSEHVEPRPRRRGALARRARRGPRTGSPCSAAGGLVPGRASTATPSQRARASRPPHRITS